MSEYIDRDKAFEAVDKRVDELKGDKQFTLLKEICVRGVMKYLVNIPPADVVERSEYKKLVAEGFLKDCKSCEMHLRSKIDKAIEDTYEIRREVLYNDDEYYEPNDVLDIIDQIIKLFEEL